jgi:hypothetical protein
MFIDNLKFDFYNKLTQGTVEFKVTFTVKIPLTVTRDLGTVLSVML